MARIKYVGPFDAVEVAGLGVVERLVEIDCPDDIAGAGPSLVVETVPQAVTDDDGQSVLDAAGEVVLNDVEVEYEDPGHGLLAQPDNWVAVTATSKKKGA